MGRKILEARLQAVRRRNRIRILYESIFSGLLFAGILLLLFFVVHFMTGRPLNAPWIFPALGITAGIVGGGAIAFLTPFDPLQPAREIDRHYGLKDRVLTASAICKNPEQTAMEALQLDDAVLRTKFIEPHRVVPYRIFQELYKIFSVYVPVFVLCILTALGSPTVNQAAGVSNETVLLILDQLESELAVPLEELAKENPEDEELQKLNEKVGDLMKRLDSQRSDPREALLTLNRMEKEISKTIKLFDLEATDASLKELGEAFALAEATRNAAEPMIAGDFEKGAEQLEKVDFEAMSGRERQTVGDELGKVARSMERRRQARMAEMTQKLSEDIKRGDCAGCKNTACQFAGVCRKQCARKGARNKLDCQLAKLGLCKSQCAGACSSCPNRGQCASQASGGEEAGRMQAGSSNAGSEQARQPLGEETAELDTHREMQAVTGVKGEGSSETQILKTANSTKAASNVSYEKKLIEYKKQAESMLETEPVPFEQHQLIRRYFEAITHAHP